MSFKSLCTFALLLFIICCCTNSKQVKPENKNEKLEGIGSMGYTNTRMVGIKDKDIQVFYIKDKNNNVAKKIIIHIGPYNNYSLDGLKEHSDIYELEIISIHFDDVDYSVLSAFHNMKHLKITVPYIENEDDILSKIPDFPVLPSVKSLEIFNHGLETLDGIEKFPNLKGLTMTYLNLNEFQNTVKRPIKNLKALTLLPELRLLKISDQESIIRISDLIGLKNLKELQLPWGCNTIDFTNINHLNSLETIEIGSSGGQGMNINTVNIEEIGGLHNIKRLLIPIRSNVESAGFLSTILSLEELYLFNGSYPDSVFVSDALNDIAYRRRPLDMNIFRNLRNLKYLIMNGFIIKNSGTLNGLQQLELIGIENSSFNSNEDNILINPDILKIPNITIYTGYEH